MLGFVNADVHIQHVAVKSLAMLPVVSLRNPDEKKFNLMQSDAVRVSGLMRATLKIYCGESFLYHFTLHLWTHAFGGG